MSRGTRRSYHSPLRRGQAEETRRRIFEAAAATFVARGFSGTTMREVAVEADVSVERVFQEGSKAHLLVQAFRLRYTGEYDWDSILGNQWAQDMFAVNDPQQGLEMSVEFCASAHARSADLWMILRAVALSEPTVAEEMDRLLAFKRESWLQSVRWLTGLGIITVDDPDRLPAVAAVANVMCSAETYVQLRTDWQMSDLDYRDWLRHATTKFADLTPGA